MQEDGWYVPVFTYMHTWEDRDAVECGRKTVMNIFAFWCNLLIAEHFIGHGKLGKECGGEEHIALMDLECCARADLVTGIHINLANFEIYFRFYCREKHVGVLLLLLLCSSACRMCRSVCAVARCSLPRGPTSGAAAVSSGACFCPGSPRHPVLGQRRVAPRAVEMRVLSLLGIWYSTGFFGWCYF